MTLSRWFRDYVYIPLGGNRGASGATYRNLMIVFVLTGFWHGAAWSFVLWGLYHGAWMLIERRIGLAARWATAVRHVVLRRAVTFLIVLVGWVLFRAETLSDRRRSFYEVDARDLGRRHDRARAPRRCTNQALRRR